MNRAVNPYLPEGTYIPDGEPHVFDGRIYIFGIHDLFDAENYCEGDFEVWSAPIDNLADWRNDGVIFPRKNPANPNGEKCMWAPDVCRGSDGRFYTVYAELIATSGVYPVYVTYRGTGTADFLKLHFA